MTRKAKAICLQVCVVVLLLWFAVYAAEGPKGQATVKQAWGEEQDGWKLSIVSDKETYAVWEKMELRVVLKNVGTTQGRIIVSGLDPLDGPAAPIIEVLAPEDARAAVMFDEKGKEPEGKEQKAPLTLYGKWVTRLRTGSIHSETLDPAKEDVVSCHLNRFFDMTLSGEYRVSATRRVPKRDGTGWTMVKSNMLRLMVVDEEKDGSGKEQTKK